MLLRSLTLRLFYNYRLLFGVGVAYCLCSCQKRRAKELFWQDSVCFFNTNEYLSGFALGVLLKLEEENRLEELERTRQLCLSLTGGLGDRWFYGLLIPLLIVIPANILIWTDLKGLELATWMGLFLLAGFSVLNFYLRWIGIVWGYREGVKSFLRLKNPIFIKVETILTNMLEFLGGLFLGGILLNRELLAARPEYLLLLLLSGGLSAFFYFRRTALIWQELGFVLLLLTGWLLLK